MQKTDVLAEGSSYKRMRLSQSFSTPTKAKNKTKKHSPEHLLQSLHNWPTDEKINWTQIANEHNVTGANRGQIVKEFAAENGREIGWKTR